MQQRRLRILCLALLLSSLAYASSLFLLPAKEASAHTFVIGSDPVDGTTINEAPAVVRIYFNAPLSSLSRAHVYAFPNGQQVEVTAGPSRISPTNPRELDTPLKDPATLPKGSYEVMWTAVDNADGHTTFGLIGFNIGFSGTGLAGTPTLGPTTSNDLEGIRALTAPNLMGILWEWITLVALIVWLGLLATERILAAKAGRTLLLIERVQRQTYSLQWLCLCVLLLSEVVNLLLRDVYLNTALQQSLFRAETLGGLLFGTHYGWFWLARIALLLTAMIMLWRGRQTKIPTPELEPAQRKVTTETGPLRQYVTGDLSAVTTASIPRERTKAETATVRPEPVYRYTWALLCLAALFLLAHILSGEETQVLQLPISAHVFDWLNLAAQSVWFGGMAYLSYILLPPLPSVERDHHVEILSTVLQRLMPFLLVVVGVQLVSWFFLSEASISTVLQLISDNYGRTLLVQGIILLVLLGLSSYTLFVLRPRLTRMALLLLVVDLELPARRKRQTSLDQSRQALKLAARLQSWLGAAVLLCTALMSFFAPPIVFPDIAYSNPSAQSVTQATLQTQQIGNLTATLQVLPARVGVENTLVLTLAGPDGKLVTDARVQIDTNMQTMDMGVGHVTLTKGGPTYVAVFDTATAFDMAGLWNIDVSIQRNGQAPVKGTFKVMINS